VRDASLEDSWRRVAHALATVEVGEQALWEQRFFDLLQGFRFLPAGRILAGAGTAFDVTLFNCFVMGPISDSIEGIFDALKDGALTMQLGGGVGYDFSTLRPAGTPAWRVGGIASGPVSFMRIWDSMCQTLLSTAARRGAMMATLRCDHPDIEAFVQAKQTPGALQNFNLSILVSDAFMQAIADDAVWPLVFPVEGLGGAAQRAGRQLTQRAWSGYPGPTSCQILGEIPARVLWDKITRANYQCAEPGVLFIDRINQQNNLGYRERISATNPCGEIPLPPFGACDLGSLNLTRFVIAPFSPHARLDLDALGHGATTAVRLLDNVIDHSRFPLKPQQEQAQGARRIGLGITGLADSLIMLGVHYGSVQARRIAANTMQTVCHAAYRASIDLAAEKGSFPFFDRDAYLQRPFVRGLPTDLRQGIAATGLRNSHLTAIAPTGTISLLANNISSGIEPVFDFTYHRRIRGIEGELVAHALENYALRHWRRRFGDRPVPEYFVDARRISPTDHLAMQAAVQPFVDNAISKTINVPVDCDLDTFRSIYEQAYRLGLKGCTTFRPNPVTDVVLESGESGAGAHCCGSARDGD
jgi:ribonucleoside-diphosphate reductase alpha chain